MQVVNTIFWDLDGTLIESEILHGESLIYANEQLNLSHKSKVHDLPEGVDNQKVFELLFDEQPTPPKFDEWERVATSFMLDNAHKIVRVPQSLALLKYFAKLGMAQSLVSNANRNFITRCAQALNISEHCKYIISRDDVINGKPDPEIYLAALAKNSSKAENSLVFEDSITGIQAAVAAGITVVAVGYDLPPHETPYHVSKSSIDWISYLLKHFQFVV